MDVCKFLLGSCDLDGRTFNDVRGVLTQVKSPAMKGIAVTRAGGPENLKYENVDTPKLTDGQVLIEVYATALNGADLLQRAGNYPCPPGTARTSSILSSWLQLLL